MKKTMIVLALAAPLAFMACNNENKEKDPVEKADSTNEQREDMTPQAIQTDEKTTDFLVKAADGGMAEVDAGNAAIEKAANADVKNFASMMVTDHTDANNKVKALAGTRSVTLPMASSDDHKKSLEKLNAKTGNDFDKAFMDQMVDDHKKTIKLFEDAQNDSKDAEVKTFITNTLPTLNKHLDEAQAIRKALK